MRSTATTLVRMPRSDSAADCTMGASTYTRHTTTCPNGLSSLALTGICQAACFAPLCNKQTWHARVAKELLRCRY
jgi:hypothetical protein